MNNIRIHTPSVRLKDALKICGQSESGGQAKRMIEEGLIKVNGEVCSVKGKQLQNGDRIEADGSLYTIVYEDQ